MPTLFVAGIDTGIGKSIATGLLARHLLEQGGSVITQKLVQTGCCGPPEDILVHRRLMESGWLAEDEQRLTCPYTFSFPGSPHLAARLDNKSIDPARITDATRRLQSKFEWVILEGAGGLMVPLRDDMTMLDYVGPLSYPLILVTSSRLGSINHTLLSLEVLRQRKMRLAGLIYNTHAGGPDEIIRDSLRLFSKSLLAYGFAENILALPSWPHAGKIEWDRFLKSLDQPADSAC